MCFAVVMFFLFLPSCAGLCQSPGQENVERLVQGALNPKSEVGYDGFSEGPLNRSGDGAAVAVTKVLRDKDLNADDINRILLIIHRSFAAPKIVEIESDRQPRTTLFVLKYLTSLPLSLELKRKIAETKKFVEESTKSTAGGPPKQ